MARSPAIDRTVLLDAVRAVSSAETPDDVGRVAIMEVARLVPSTVVTLNEVDPMARRATALVEPSTFLMTVPAQAVWAEVAAEHPLIQHLERTGDGSARRISDFWSQDQFHRSVVYRRFYRPLGIEFQMSITLPEPRPVIVAIALSRSEHDFDERDRAILNILRPHLAQAWRQARIVARLQRLLEVSTGALTTTGTGVVLLDGGPSELTPGALVQLYRFFGRPGRSDPFPARVEQWLARQRTRLSGDQAELATALTGVVDDQQLSLRYLAAGEQRAEAIVLQLVSLPSPTGTDLAALGLSPREAEVLRLVAGGDRQPAWRGTAAGRRDDPRVGHGAQLVEHGEARTGAAVSDVVRQRGRVELDVRHARFGPARAGAGRSAHARADRVA